MLEHFHSKIVAFDIVINDDNMYYGWIESVTFQINGQVDKYVIYTVTGKHVDKTIKEGVHNLTVSSIVNNPFPVAK